LTTVVILATPVTPATLEKLAVVLLVADPAPLLLVLATTHLVANVMTVERGTMTVRNDAALEALTFVIET